MIKRLLYLIFDLINGKPTRYAKTEKTDCMAVAEIHVKLIKIQMKIVIVNKMCTVAHKPRSELFKNILKICDLIVVCL